MLTGHHQPHGGRRPVASRSALPAFLEFAAGTVLVAHNARFDVGFLAPLLRLSRTCVWPDFEVLDTVKLARHVVTRDEAPNHKLSSLARVFRACDDARTTARSRTRGPPSTSLHGLMERLGGLGVHTLEELQGYSSKVASAARRKRHLADGLPHAPGRLPLPRRAGAGPLRRHVASDLRRRVRSYFTASEKRTRIGADGPARRLGDRHRVRHPPGGGGA